MPQHPHEPSPTHTGENGPSSWTRYSESTQRLLRFLAATVGNDVGDQVAEALAFECQVRYERDCVPRLAALQTQLDDARTVIVLQDRQLQGRQGSRLRQVCAENAHLRQRCAELEAALARQPEDEARERDQLIEAILDGGERLGYQAVWCAEVAGPLIARGWAAYLTFTSSTQDLEQLRQACAAIELLELARAGRQKLAALSKTLGDQS